MERTIHVAGSSVGLQVYTFDVTNVVQLRRSITGGNDWFKPDLAFPEKSIAGFVNDSVEDDGEYLRGSFAHVVSFEVEAIRPGKETEKDGYLGGAVETELKYKIERCDFFCKEGEEGKESSLLVWGKGSAQKKLVETLSILVGSMIKKRIFENHQVKGIHDRMETVAGVTVKNPKGDGQGPKVVKLGGRIEDYAEFDVVEDGHILDAVSGILRRPEDEMGFSLMVKKGGGLKIGVVGEKGFDLEFGVIDGVLGLILEDVDAGVKRSVQKMVKDLKDSGVTLEVKTRGVLLEVVGEESGLEEDDFLT